MVQRARASGGAAEWDEPEKNLMTHTWEARRRRPLTRAEREYGLLSVVAGLSEAEVRKLIRWQDERAEARPRGSLIGRQRLGGSW